MRPYREKKREVYKKTMGRCHLCGSKLIYKNYGNIFVKGSWEIDHSVPRSLGGTDHLNNLFPVCTYCNKSKGNNSTRSVRIRYGRTKAPLSKAALQEVRSSNSIIGAFMGGAVGLLLGPLGLITGSLLGAKIGYDQNPEGD